MPGSPADSALYHDLFGDAATADWFTDRAEIAAMVQVEIALAQVQAALGVIPASAATEIAAAGAKARIAPEALAAETGRNAVPVPALIAAFRHQITDPAAGHFLHWGATSQDIMDTGLVLRLRPVLALWDARLTQILGLLGPLALAHADVPMAARSYGQNATPTSFGAVLAGWGHPLLRQRQALADAGAALAVVSLGGAAGTLAAMGPEGPAVRKALALALGLQDPGHSWHSARDRIATLAAAATGLAASLGKMGEDLILMTQTGIEEITLAGAGGSSTMPQKQNPVGPSVLVALARQIIALNSAIQGAALHRQQRDGAAWMTEWLSLPQLCILTGRALQLAIEVLTALRPDADRMARNLDDGRGLIHAEALSFALAARMPRPAAQAVIKDLCARATLDGPALPDLVQAAYPGVMLDPVAMLGTAPDDARAFAAAVAATLT